MIPPKSILLYSIKHNIFIHRPIDFVNYIEYNLIMDDKDFSKNEAFDPLQLKNQLCFVLYVCSKEIIKRYTPHLEKLGITYTGYITLMSLWEKDDVSVKELGSKLFLDSGTLTPLLKKLEAQNLITRNRSQKDERTVIITLTDEGRKMKEKCADIPSKMMCYNLIDIEKAPALLEELHSMMERTIQNQNS